MATNAPVPTEAETSMIRSDADTDTVNISLNIRLNFSYSASIDNLRTSYVLLVAVSVCLFVAVAVYQTVMKAIMIVLVVDAMVTLSYALYVYMNKKVNFTTQFSIIKYPTKERRRDQNSEIHVAASVLNMGNVDPGISRMEETPQVQRHPETGTNNQDDTETISSTAGLQSDVVNSAPIIRDEDDSSSDEDDLCSEDSDRTQMTPLYRSPVPVIHRSQPYQQLQPSRSQVQLMTSAVVEFIHQLTQGSPNNVTPFQCFQELPERQMQRRDFLSPIFGFPFDENRAVVPRRRPTPGSESRSLVVRRRNTASTSGPYCDNDELKPYFNAIVNTMAVHWPQLATELGLPFPHILLIKQQNNNDCWMCCHHILETWRRNNGREATKEGLIQAVKETGNLDVAETLEDMLID